MNPSSYKQITTTRGFKYNYYVSAGDPSKPILLFIHGFPSTSYDWHLQVSFFKKEGFGMIVPDVLGHGQTDKPTDPAAYKHSGMAADIVNILDAENVDKAIAIGHDWHGCLSALLASLEVTFMRSGARLYYDAAAARLKQAIGYEPFGYWHFFSEDGANKVIMEHGESFLNLFYPRDPIIWKEHMCPPGEIKEWLLADKKAPPASYLTEQDREDIMSRISIDGLAGGLNWYKVYTLGITSEDDRQIPEANHVIQQPVLYIGGKMDYVCVPAIGYPTLNKYCPNRTLKEYDAGHWLQFEVADQVNNEILAWINDNVKL
ncbi:uncharacterized protein FIBRA_01369 [Fibroporia radiculosa]|uniref:AB hydrolase-1 domain-containing protein n=1 Tax=Fibroporia radiculosa TaxID=599839 RepID=J4I8G1_9APHY|nr:uncharacterized protein FIBRA_01369 [Fibroporia radiculosa]CCL99351.1 predicted protein [Fibroporia radiculosa]